MKNWMFSFVFCSAMSTRSLPQCISKLTTDCKITAHLQHTPDKLQILIQFPATWKQEPPLPPLRPLRPSHLDQTCSPSSLKPPGVVVQKCAARWTEGVFETAGGQMNVHASETENGAAMVGQVHSEAPKCCSEPKTPGCGMTRKPLQLQLKKV